MTIDLDAIEQRAKEALRLQEAATRGPWQDKQMQYQGIKNRYCRDVVSSEDMPVASILTRGDAALIAHSRTSPCPADVLTLTAEIRRLREVAKQSSDLNDLLGFWMSGALDDDGVCAEMKADISKWFDGQNVLAAALAKENT